MGKIAEVQEVTLTKLVPYENNAKKHPQDQIDLLIRSINEYGFINPCLIDKDFKVIAGHGRIEAAKQMGMDKVPCLFVEGLTEAQYKAYVLADNRLTELGEWNMDLVMLELQDLQDMDFDISLTGFEMPEEEEEIEVIEDEVPEEVESRCKLGDIWQLGEHRLICGDSTSVDVLDSLMGGVKADMVFTDPPYGMNAVSNSGVLSQHYKTDILNDDDNTVAISAFNMAQSYFKDAKQIWWGANYYTECLPSSECWLVWDKNNGASDQTDCELAWANYRSVVRQFTMASEKKNRVHPTQKPVRLFAEIMEKFDKNKSVKTVVDLFGGSGSTLMACEQLKRKCYVCELDEHYCDVIIERWETFTGREAVLLNGEETNTTRTGECRS